MRLKSLSKYLFAATLSLLSSVAMAQDKVRFAMSSVSMLNLPLYVSDVMGYFRDQKIDAELTQFKTGGSTALAAVLGRNSDIYVGATSSGIAAVDRGSDAVVIGAVMTEFALNIVLNKDVAARLGVDRAKPIGQRLAALKGLRIGVTGAGSATHQITQYALRYAKLDPERDSTIAFVNSGGDMLAAMMTKNVDAIVAANPTSDVAMLKQGGVLLVNGAAGDYPGLEGIAHIVLVTNKSWARQNPDRTSRTLEAIRQGQLAIHDEAKAAKARDLVYAKYFSGLDRQAFDSAWKNAEPGFPTSPRLKADQIAKNIDFLKQFSDERYTVAPEKVFTNDYIKN